MPTVLVRGLTDEGPGDIVGAFAGEADVDPDRIGEISIDDDEAAVDLSLSDDALADVLETMDGNRVGRSEVSVTTLDETTRAVRDYVDEQSRLVELEREAEMERHEREIRQLSDRERESKGRALLGMRGRDEDEGLSGRLVKFTKRRGDALPDTEISVGDLVMLSKRDPLRDDNPTATVTQVTNHSVTVSFGGSPRAGSSTTGFGWTCTSTTSPTSGCSMRSSASSRSTTSPAATATRRGGDSGT